MHGLWRDAPLVKAACHSYSRIVFSECGESGISAGCCYSQSRRRTVVQAVDGRRQVAFFAGDRRGSEAGHQGNRNTYYWRRSPAVGVLIHVLDVWCIGLNCGLSREGQVKAPCQMCAKREDGEADQPSPPQERVPFSRRELANYRHGSETLASTVC